MRFVLLGRGKTGALVEEIARERGHELRVITAAENSGGSALTREALSGVDAVIDFTSPHAILENIRACAAAGANMVVGTTGWYEHLDEVRNLVEKSGTGFVYAANFSIGVNLFFDIARAAAAAIKQGYRAEIMERHHVHKKDAPSGTAVMLQKAIQEASGEKLNIVSVREGETVGLHVVILDSDHDSIMLTHDAKSRRGFAEGAVRAAEWIAGKRGFYEFPDVLKQLS